MVQALKRRGVHSTIIKEAENFRCSVCTERARPQPRNISALEPQPTKFATLSADIGHFVHPESGEHVQIVVFVDEGSRFRVSRVITRGKKQHPSAAQFISVLKEAWIAYFGIPLNLRVDPDGAFRSHGLADFCDQQRIFLDIIPGEGHWKLGVCERSIQAIKELLQKVCQDHPDSTIEDALSECVRVLNNREVVRGYSPIQHVLGRAPDDTGRIFTREVGQSPDITLETPITEHQKSAELRLTAEKAFLDWNNSQRLQRASNSKHRRLLDFSAGDLVYIWRKQVTGKDAKPVKTTNGKFVGPARILATENRRDDQGHLIAGSSVWLVRGRRLLKCCPEQLRHASEREKILDELHAEDSQPWSFPRVAGELGGNDYEDWSEQPPEEEWRRAGDPQHEWQPAVRQRGKRPTPPDYEVSSCPEGSASSRLRRSSELQEEQPDVEMNQGVTLQPPPCGFQSGPDWTTQVRESAYLSSEEESYWNKPTAAITIEIDMPQTRGASERAIKDLSAFLVSAMKKRAIEVSEKRMTEEDRQAFTKAKAIEVSNFIAARAFEALPAGYRGRKEDAVRMRWILTWKALPGGGKKAKARAVLLGYQDPGYEGRATTSPTTTRQTRQVQLIIAAARGFQTWKGDVTGAFLQSREYPDQLLCIPCPEILAAMGLAPETLTRVRKACYGLVDAPLEWYRSISEFFHAQGLRRCWSDPCCWTYVSQGELQGLISGHVDDFVFSGNEDHAGWQSILTAIQKQYKWSDWEKDSFVQCGVRVERSQDGTYALSQESYIEDLKYINIRAHRKQDKHGTTDDWEKSQLRTLLGGVSWLAQQTAPHFAAETSLLLSEVSQSTVETLHRANKLMNQVKSMKEHKMLIPKVNLKHFGLFVWCDAAAQNRTDGGSTQGFLIGAASLDLLKGSCEAVSPISWNSSRIQRVCRSPGASETAAAVNAEDALFFARFQFSEMLGHTVRIRAVNESVNRIPGCLITDSRNVFDKTKTEVICTKGNERRVDIEMMCLKHGQLRNGVIIRWVHSDAQLSNSLTKNEQRQLQMFYKMKQHWRIVQDINMASARKRKEQNMDPLENNHIPQDTTQNIQDPQ